MSYPWERLPEVAQRQIKAACLICFVIGLFSGIVLACVWVVLL